jgi:1,4-dihydroxy-2-naphthoate octaprenyltransferase
VSTSTTTVAPRQLSRRRLWIAASRPATLPASISPVLVGVSIAAHDHRVRIAAALLTLVVAMALQIGVNYANDYSDFRRGADTPARIGPIRAAASGLVAPRHVLYAALASFTVAACAGLAVALIAGPWLVAVGATCIAAAWFYTGGPRPYGYAGFGELFVFVFFGLVATCGTVYVNERHIPLLALFGGVAMGCFAVAVLLLNNIRDVESDAAAGKRTLAVRTGRAAARGLFFTMLGVAYAMPVVAVLTGRAAPLALLPLVTAPLTIVPLRNSAQRAGPPLIRALIVTARTMALYAIAWAIAMVFS